ncbi:hypothetical protein Chor_002113 [Crotalus horridus]
MRLPSPYPIPSLLPISLRYVETGSESFQRLLSLLGDTVTLKGWNGYRGGLDTKRIYSIYTVYQGHEIMFHVSTMLPYSKENKQQVERKRHIGNDIVTIVFQEGEAASPAFKPSMIRSHFTRPQIEDHCEGRRPNYFSHYKPLQERDGQPPIPVFDKTLQIKQMHVLETLDLLITRADKGKEARLLVFRLNALWKGVEARLSRSKSECRENKLEKTKGCHLYAINTHHSNELRIIVAIRNKLLLVTRKFRRWETLNGAPLVSPQSESPVEEFQYIREICLSDPPVVMTLVDGPTGENDNLICVAYRHQFDLVSESTGECYRMHNVDASRVNFVAAIDVYEDGEAALLLCYNFCAFPYILAFTNDSIEIRLVVNGNLVHTAVVPALQLVASRSDIYFRAATAVSEVSNSSSKETSLPGSPQTPSVQENLIFSPSSAEGKLG